MARHAAGPGPARRYGQMLGAAALAAPVVVLVGLFVRAVQPIVAPVPARIIDGVLAPLVFTLTRTEVLGLSPAGWIGCAGAVMVLVGLVGLRVRWGWRLVDRLLEDDRLRGTDAVVAREDAELRRVLAGVESAGDVYLPVGWAKHYGERL